LSKKKILSLGLVFLIVSVGTLVGSMSVSACKPVKPGVSNQKVKVLDRKPIAGGVSIKLLSDNNVKSRLTISTDAISKRLLFDFSGNDGKPQGYWECVADCIEWGLDESPFHRLVCGFPCEVCLAAIAGGNIPLATFTCSWCLGCLGGIVVGCAANCAACFVGETGVLMWNGTYKPIERVQVDERISSFNVTNGKFEPALVTKVHHHSPKEMGEYFLVVNGKLKVTPNHPLIVDYQWKTVGDIKKGSTLLTMHGPVVVQNVRKVYKKVWTYDLELDENHPIYIADDFIVNPKGPPYFPLFWLIVLLLSWIFGV